MPKFFRFPWATTGDKTTIPDETDLTGLVSYQQGYGADYARDPATDPLAKLIERDKMNQLFSDLTENAHYWQTHAFPEYITSAQNGGTAFAYDVDAIVRYDSGTGYKLYQNTTAANTNLPTGAGWVVYDIASLINASAAKTTPVDADLIGIADSAASFGLKKLSLANLWNYIKAKADLLYAPIGYGNSLLAEYVVTGSAVTSINFSGLDINTHKSYRIEVELLNATASSATISCFVNNDTSGGNYYTQELNVSGSSVVGARTNAAYICALDASSFVSATQFVSRTNGYAGIKSFVSRLSGTSLTRDDYYMVKSATVTNITQLTFVSSVASSIGIGSKIRIYRGDI